MADPITAAEVREWSRVDFGGLEYPAPTPPETADPLQRLVDRAIEYVLRVTGLGGLGNVPSDRQHTWEEAVQRRTEQLVFKAQEDEVETAADFELINNFSAGSYSETRRGLGEVEKARQINPWPLLNDLLWGLATEDAKDEWEDYWNGDSHAPAFDVSEMDWDYFGPASAYMRPSDLDPDSLI